jgi:hypothetical protein
MIWRSACLDIDRETPHVSAYTENENSIGLSQGLHTGVKMTFAPRSATISSIFALLCHDALT